MDRIKANFTEIFSWIAIFAFLALLIWLILPNDPEARNIGILFCVIGGLIVASTAGRK